MDHREGDIGHDALMGALEIRQKLERGLCQVVSFDSVFCFLLIQS